MIGSELFSGRISLLRAVGRMGDNVKRASFLAALLDTGLLQKSASSPVSFEGIATMLGCRPGMEDGLKAWLQLGVKLGALEIKPAGYVLHSKLARKLAEPRNDAIAAMLQSIPTEQRLVLETPARVRSGTKFTLGEQRSDLVARASRQLERFVHSALNALIPRRGAFRVLDVGCGSAGYLKYVAGRNPQLTALGIDQAPDIVRRARSNIEHWRLGDRVSIEDTDLKTLTVAAGFDLALLNLVLHYSPERERTPLLAQVRALLRPDGKVLITNPTGHGNSRIEWLNLWGEMTEGSGSVPEPGDIERHLNEAGFRIVQSYELIPGAGFMCFQARRSK